MSGSVDFTVIVPAHQAEALLPDTLSALTASSLPRATWQLVVVDDASRDATAAVSKDWADDVISLTGTPIGPGGARNAGAAIARGTWLVFIDADVRVHADTLARIAAAIHRDPDLVALFGSYDASPAARGLLSEYRNLLHRFVHLRGAGEAETFWAGCGAVRRDAFEAIGGFDTRRFPRPQIEDIELGYRLRDRGGRILLDPTIQGTHLKRWRLGAMLRTDFRDRGIPWTRLLLERRGRTAPTLNTGRSEQLRVALAGSGAAALVAGILLRDSGIALIGALLFVVLGVTNVATYAWFARERGVMFAVAVIPLHLTYYISNALAASIGLGQHLLTPSRTPQDAAGARSEGDSG